ncbi:hypothetical protein D3C71_1493670 [compost metagenome]
MIGLGETIRRADHAVAPGAALFVAGAVEWRDHFAADLAGLFQNGGGGFFIDHFGQAR